MPYTEIFGIITNWVGLNLAASLAFGLILLQ
ncbi:hypothetical protein DMTZ50_0567 [Dehalococcoides mccartyi]|uniref:Uncharacterized protein n=1 Tax=Dehalococcoides mccartyi TaxID=61435 RepID=A0A142V959_9CHLR|nr:hypothetical protein Dm11a5_0324 [Dehalococcoides mccartyi]MBA2084762.1 hypothetical protein [Dehalococcoides mccartyi]